MRFLLLTLDTRGAGVGRELNHRAAMVTLANRLTSDSLMGP